MIATFLWWLVIQLFALAALPLAWTLFARLPGRGYPLAKALGLLLVAFIAWLGASFHLLPNTIGGVLVALLAVAALSISLGRDGLSRRAEGGRPLFGWLRANWRLVLTTELLFLLILVGWAAYRAYNPDISGTEKPMELAFVNGVLSSSFSPPQDPWLAGYGISYYYFGYVMLAVLIRLTGVLPEVGFNLGAALWYALTMIGAFGVVYDLVRLPQATRHAPHEGRSIRYGLLGALFVGVLGNLEGVIELAYHKSLVPLSWIQWLDIKQVTDNAPSGGLTGGFWWWWRASRVIHDKDLLGNSIEVIDEFPFFSYLLGDMHPHVLGLPFVLLAIALALNLLLEAGLPAKRAWKLAPADVASPPRASRLAFHVSRFWRFLGSLTGLGAPGILLYAVVLGALGFLNTWDFPIYVALATLALGVGLAQQNGMSWSVAGRAAAGGAVLAVLGWLLYLPFYLGFQSQLGGVLPNLLFPSRLSQFFVMFGPFLVVTVGFLILVSRETRQVLRSTIAMLPWTLLAPLVLFGAIVLGMAVLPQGRAYVQEVLRNPAVQANIGSSTLRDLAGLVVKVRAATPWTYLALALLIAWAAGVLWARLRPVDRAPGGQDDAGVPDRAVTLPSGHLVMIDLFVVVMIGIALALTLAPEFLYLRDLFGNRMNTVFKFYYQAWVLLALASAYGVSRLAGRETHIALKAPVLILTGVLVLGGLWYPAAAIPSKADNFRVDRASGDPRPTLDGLAYLRRSNPAQMAAIEWLRTNVAPDAVVIEATGGSYSEYGRVSMATGNPTLLGWDWHERQWRGNVGYEKLAAGRPEALEQIYRTARPEALPALLDQWGVDYVYIGELERSKYKISEAALARFDLVLTRVYDQDGVLIYAR